MTYNEQDNDNQYNEHDPIKTLSDLLDLDENDVKSIIDQLSLTEYVALATAIQNKDLDQITEIVDKKTDVAVKPVEEAVDIQTKSDLQKLANKMPKTSQPNNNVSMAKTNTQAGQTKPTQPITPISGTTQPNAPQPQSTTPQNPQQPLPPLTNNDIAGIDVNSGTFAVRDQKNKNKVDIKNIKDPKQSDEIKDLLKRAGGPNIR